MTVWKVRSCARESAANSATRKVSRALTSAATALLFFVLNAPPSASACAVCFGASDSPWGKALNWGILALLGVVALVLGGIVAFFMHMARRARMLPQLTTQEKLQP